MKRIYIDHEPFTLSHRKVEAFPWVRLDAGAFIWEEAFVEGNYLTAFYTCMGRGQSRERLLARIQDNRVYRMHRLAFEVEIDGQLLMDYFQWDSEEILHHSNGSDELVVTLRYALLPIVVKVHSLLDGTNFITRWIEVENHDERSHAVTGMFPLTGIIATPRWEGYHNQPVSRNDRYTLGHYRSNFIVGEGEFCFEPLQQGSRAFINNKANYNPRMFILRNEMTGENFVLDMECTAHAHVEFSYWTDLEHLPGHTPTMPVVQLRMGLARAITYRTLAPGASVTSPIVHFGAQYGDLDECVNAHYRHLRRSVLPPHPVDKRNLVELNHSGYSFNEHMTEQYLRNEVDLAESIGAEMFLVDAGWFGRFPDSWGKSQGEWDECAMLDGGLGRAFDYARSKGMKCGLWIAIEEAGQESRVRKEHPEWMLYEHKKPMGYLDLTKPEVQEHLYETLSGVIQRYKLDLFRIDGGYNQAAQEPMNGYLECKSWAYFEQLYRLVERIAARFPGILLENCSGGGGRIDLGMLRRFHYTQMSDNWSPSEQVRILNGMTLAYPPVHVQSMIGAMNDRTSDLDFMIRSAMICHFVASGIATHIDRSNPEALARWQHGVDIHKRIINPMIYDCAVYHHTPFQVYNDQGDWVVLEYVSADQRTAIAALFRLEGGKEPTFPLVFRGLNKEMQYRVTYDNFGDELFMTGAMLCSQGLNIRVPGALTSELLILQA